MPRYLLALAVFALAIYAVSDVLASNDQRRNNTPKPMWILITLFIPLLGPIIWIVFSNSNKSATPRSTTGRTPRPSSRKKPTGPVAPDDDPDFLWKLEAEQRRRKAEEDKKKQSESKEKQSEGTAKDNDSPTEPDGSNDQ